MKRLFMIASIAMMASSLSASPAATQDWVRKYVATNTVVGAATEEWVRSYVASNSATRAWVIDYIARNTGGMSYNASVSSNSFDGIMTSFYLAKARAQSSCTNPAYASMSAVANLNSLTLAPLSDVLYTNAVAGVYMTLTGGVFDLHDGAISYVSGTNLTGVIDMTCSTNGIVSIYSTVVTDADINKAKGE